MARFMPVVIVLLLFFGKQETGAKITYGIEEAINDVSFIPGAKFILTSAVKLWLLYGEVRNLAQPNSTQIQNQLVELSEKLDEISLKLDDMSEQIDAVAESIKDVKNIINDKVIMELPKEINMNQKRDDFANLITKVVSLFHNFLLYNNNNKTFTDETLLNFANAVIDHRLDQLPSVLNQIAGLIVDTSGSFNMINVLANKHLSNTLVCAKEESPLHQISSIYQDAMVAEMKSLLMTRFAYEVKQKLSPNPVNFDEELNTAEELFFTRTSKIVRKVKSAMVIAHQDYWTCNLPLMIEGDTFAKVGPVFQKYIIKEKDVYEEGKVRQWDKIKKGCSGSCQSRTNGTDQCLSKHCKSHNLQCKGRVINCESFQPSLFMCLAGKDSGRRYEFLESQSGKGKGQVFGQKKTCPSGQERYVKESKVIPLDLKDLTCEFCLCTCLHDNSEEDIDRYFSLRDVTSDIESNKIVTGVRFAKKNRIFHIQIQEGELIKNGCINQTSVDWRNVDDHTIADGQEGQDYQTVTWEERTVNLDDLNAGENQVLTGLRFGKVSSGIKLEIQVTPFDFATGVLHVEHSRWMSNPGDSPRTELNLEDRALPSALKYQYLDSSDNQFLKFTTSSVKDDVGQSVVPYIDLKAVTTEVAVPLAGAGLIHKSNNEDSAGFLSFKLFTYNYAPHLEL